MTTPLCAPDCPCRAVRGTPEHGANAPSVHVNAEDVARFPVTPAEPHIGEPEMIAAMGEVIAKRDARIALLEDVLKAASRHLDAERGCWDVALADAVDAAGEADGLRGIVPTGMK